MQRTKKRLKLMSVSWKISISIVIYIIWVISSSIYNYSYQKKILVQEIDKQLTNGAMAIPLILGDGFHHKDMNKTYVSQKKDLENIKLLSRFSDNQKLNYAYTIIRNKQKILFTSSSATTKEINTKENLATYFSKYDDAPTELVRAFDTGNIQFAEYSDKWGHFRSVFIPQNSSDGMRYVSATDIEIDYIESILKEVVIDSIISACLSLLFMIPFIIAFYSQLLLSKKSLEQEVKDRTKELDLANINLLKMAMHDPLTGLPNRRFFKENLENKISQSSRDNEKISILYIDLDGFKSINDNIGHKVGDEVLCILAKRFNKFLRRNELIARLGGDEFCMIIYKYKDKEELKNIAKRLIDTMTKTMSIGGIEVEFGMTIGIACYPEDGKTYDELLSSADVAMYDAKKKERGTYVFSS